jgi:aryl-alcohol dehydrogenase-like predicted oxidoreductase
LQQPGVTAPIVGPKTLEQAEDNFQIFGWTIPEEDVKKLSDASKPKAPYPYSWDSTSAY